MKTTALATAFTTSALTLAALMLTGAAHATAMRGEQNGVTYLNGGDSVPQVKRLERREHGYNLRLVFSEGRKNDYAADVHLKISDHHGKTVLDLAGAGPLTDVKLPDGTYRVDAHFGAMAQHDTVQIRGGKPVDLYLHFPHDAAVS